jgi:hypothetical protein
MKPENEAKLAKIKKMSGILQWICRAFLLVVVYGWGVTTWRLVIWRGAMPGIRAGVDHAVYWFGFYGMEFKAYDLSDRDRVMAELFFLLVSGVIFNCGYQLHRLLGYYSRGEVFTTVSAGQIRKCGIACVLWGLMKFVLILVPLVISNAYNAEPRDGTSLVVIGLVIVVISWFMEMAAEMREEQELIV